MPAGSTGTGDARPSLAMHENVNKEEGERVVIATPTGDQISGEGVTREEKRGILHKTGMTQDRVEATCSALIRGR